MNQTSPLRIGALGAARITPMALTRPAKFVPEAVVVAVAARNPVRARAFAAKHGIPRVHDTYDALIADPEIDAIYNPLPNSLHCVPTIRALQAGKHVLCEKPIASNAAEAEQMADAAARSGRILMEAFHYRYHPLAARMKAIVDSGELGGIRHIEANFCILLPFLHDIRFDYALAGGSTMDTGCYAINMVRFLAGAEPEVVRAEARLLSPQIDRYMAADFRFPDGRTGRITCALRSAWILRINAQVRGDRGDLCVFNPIGPHYWHRLRLRTPNGTIRERVTGEATYTHQLRAFVKAVRTGVPPPTDPPDAIANMRVIDAIYEKAGLKRRGT